VTTFLQLHYLTVYPPSNPNRDDMGRPKQALIGGAPRLRLSSQSIKRAVRTSPLFQEALAGHIGDRTKRIGEVVRDALDGTGEADVIRRVAIGVADVFAKMDAKANADETKIRTAQLAFISPDERVAAIETARKWMAEGLIPPEAGTKLNKEQLAAQKKEEKALMEPLTLQCLGECLPMIPDSTVRPLFRLPTPLPRTVPLSRMISSPQWMT